MSIELTLTEMFDRVDKTAVANNLSQKDTNVLRVLAEEMLVMASSLVNVDELDFLITSNGGEYELRLSVRAWISPEKKREFIGLSTKKENVSAKGIRGKLMSLFEDFLYVDEETAYWRKMYGMSDGCAFGFQTVWSLSEYMNNAPENEQKSDWDRLEKSILINIADDIIIGATVNGVDMIVKKTL